MMHDINPMEKTDDNDEKWMARALELAAEAAGMGEVPVGALIVQGNEVVAEAFNRKESLPLATAHAEIMAIDEACRKLGRWRLSGCTLYVTLEPCLMCVGAIVQSRVDRVVYGTPDPKAGAIHSVYQIFHDQKLNHTPLIAFGTRQNECARILSQFFADLRQQKKNSLLKI